GLLAGNTAAGDLVSVGKCNARNTARKTQNSAKDIGQIQSSVAGAAQHQAQVVAGERCAGSEFSQEASELVNADGQHLGEPRLAQRGSAVGRELCFEIAHAVRHPEMRCLTVIGEHAHAIFDQTVQFVKQVSVYADSGRDCEVTKSREIGEIPIVDSSYRNSLRDGSQ